MEAVSRIRNVPMITERKTSAPLRVELTRNRILFSQTSFGVPPEVEAG